jgi:hypothetical protein
MRPFCGNVIKKGQAGPRESFCLAPDTESPGALGLRTSDNANTTPMFPEKNTFLGTKPKKLSMLLNVPIN